MNKDWNKYFGSNGDPGVTQIDSKDRYFSVHDQTFYFSNCYFYEFSDRGVYILKDSRIVILLAEYSSFVSCYETSTSGKKGGGALSFGYGGQSVLDHVCFSFCWSTYYGQSFFNTCDQYRDSGYKNYMLSCSITNCGKNKSTGYYTISWNFGEIILENTNLSANKCINNAGYNMWYSKPDGIAKFVIVTNCKSSTEY